MFPWHPSSEPPPRPIQSGPKVLRYPHTSYAEATDPHPLAPPGGRTPETGPAEQEAGRRPTRRNSPSCLLVLVTSLLLAAIFASAGIGLVTVTPPSVLAPSRTSSGGTLPPTVADLQQQVIAVIQRVQPSVVEIEERTASGPSNGSTPRLSNLIQTSAPINPGNSGGALVDLQGRLSGIPTLGTTSAETGAVYGIGFALPSDRVNSVTERLIQESKTS